MMSLLVPWWTNDYDSIIQDGTRQKVGIGEGHVSFMAIAFLLLFGMPFLCPGFQGHDPLWFPTAPPHGVLTALR